MKNEEKQEFRSSGVLTLLGLLGLSAVIVITPWNRALQDAGVEECRQKAEVVGYQVVQIYREASKVQSSQGTFSNRTPASINDEPSLDNTRTTGTMGTDPWGQPYRYRIISSDTSKIRILVWSAGPNKKVESTELDDESLRISMQPSYSGDDLGVILSVSQN